MGLNVTSQPFGAALYQPEDLVQPLISTVLTPWIIQSARGHHFSEFYSVKAYS